MLGESKPIKKNAKIVRGGRSKVDLSQRRNKNAKKCTQGDCAACLMQQTTNAKPLYIFPRGFEDKLLGNSVRKICRGRGSDQLVMVRGTPDAWNMQCIPGFECFDAETIQKHKYVLGNSKRYRSTAGLGCCI